MHSAVGLAISPVVLVICYIGAAIMVFLLTVIVCSLREEERRRAGKVAVPLSAVPDFCFCKIKRGSRTEDMLYQVLHQHPDAEKDGFRIVSYLWRIFYLPQDTPVVFSDDYHNLQ